MTSNVRALERVKLLRAPSDRPDRTEVEAAIRTLIEWTGDDPDRDGLAETPSRVARAFEEFFAGYGQDPVEMLQKTFEEIEGYERNDCVARHSFRKPLRTSHGAHHRPGLGGLRSKRPCGWN